MDGVFGQFVDVGGGVGTGAMLAAYMLGAEKRSIEAVADDDILVESACLVVVHRLVGVVGHARVFRVDRLPGHIAEGVDNPLDVDAGGIDWSCARSGVFAQIALTDYLVFCHC